MSYLEHEKLRAVADKSQTCGEFLEWLQDVKNITLSQYHKHNESCVEGGEKICGMSTSILYPASLIGRKLLYEFFQIDEAKLEEEKRAMLAELRKGK